MTPLDPLAALPNLLGKLPALIALRSDLWYALHLIVVVSLVYAATRHELMRDILRHAARVALLIAGFMGAVFVVLAVISARL